MEPARILAEQVDGLRHEYRVALDPQQVREAVDAQLRRAGKRLTVPGFRPGRAPLAILRSHHGKRFHNEIVDRLAIDVARRLIAERGLSPLGRPSIRMDPAAPETFVLAVEITPDITLGDMADIRIHRLQIENADADSNALAREYVRRQLFDALIAQCNFPVPTDWFDTEYAMLVDGYRDAVHQEPDPTTRSDLEAIAERRIRLALLLSEIARSKAIEVPRGEIEQRIEQIAGRDPEHQDEIIDYYLDHPTAMAELQSPLLEERVVDFILEHCHISEETVDAEHLRMRVLGATAGAS